jgi:hypothetical protein
VTPNVPAVLSATSGAVPALLLVYAVQGPLVSYLARDTRQDDLNTEALFEAKRWWKWPVRILFLPAWIVHRLGGSTAALLLFASLVVLIGSIGLQAIPAEYWVDHSAAGWGIIVFDLFFLMYLAGVVVLGIFQNIESADETVRRDGTASAD